MWAGTRNISTALMRSWGNRSDTLVIDEPFYGAYLLRRRPAHPGATEIVAHTETDPSRVIERLLAALPPGKSIFYQKHMTHHILPEIDRTWLGRVTNCFLIRDPAEVIDTIWRPRAREERQRSERGEPRRHRVVELPPRSFRAKRLRGAFDGLVVDG